MLNPKSTKAPSIKSSSKAPSIKSIKSSKAPSTKATKAPVVRKRDRRREMYAATLLQSSQPRLQRSEGRKAP